MTKPKKETPPPQTGKDEMNLVEFPFATIHPNDQRKVIVYEGWVRESEQPRQVRWTVEGGAMTGLPNEFGVRIFLALLLLADEQGWPEQVTFTIYRILQILDLPDTKQYYEATKQELIKLGKVTVSSDGAFWDNDNKKRITIRQFHLLEDLHMTYLLDGDTYTEDENGNYVVFGKQVLKSAKAGYIKRLDFAFYRSLRKPLSRQLYRFLDKRLRYRGRFEIDVFDLANRLGMARYRYPSDVKKALAPAIEELVEQGFLAEGTVVKVGSYTRIRFVKQAQRQELPENTGTVLATDEEEPWEEAWTALEQQYGTGSAEVDLEAQFHDFMRYAVNEPTYHAYIAGVRILTCSDDTVVLGVPNEVCKEFLQARLLEKITSFCQSQMGGTMAAVTFEVLRTRANEAAETGKDKDK